MLEHTFVLKLSQKDYLRLTMLSNRYRRSMASTLRELIGIASGALTLDKLANTGLVDDVESKGGQHQDIFN